MKVMHNDESNNSVYGNVWVGGCEREKQNPLMYVFYICWNAVRNFAYVIQPSCLGIAQLVQYLSRTQQFGHKSDFPISSLGVSCCVSSLQSL